LAERKPVALALIELRLLVGAVGERLDWWPSRFTTEVGLRRLAIPFPRTTLQAMLESVTLVARRDHDQRLGPTALHLFRLRPPQEDMIAQLLCARGAQAAILESPAEDVGPLLDRLETLAGDSAVETQPGACCLGSVTRTRQHASVADLARVYAAAGRCGERMLPYFETNP
jgi:hypothetical protein